MRYTPTLDTASWTYLLVRLGLARRGDTGGVLALTEVSSGGPPFEPTENTHGTHQADGDRSGFVGHGGVVGNGREVGRGDQSSR